MVGVCFLCSRLRLSNLSIGWAGVEVGSLKTQNTIDGLSQCPTSQFAAHINNVRNM